METDFVFVYGSLKRGYRLFSQYLEETAFIGKATLEGYTLHKVDNAWYPGIKKGAGKVKGEVFKIGPDNLKQLDLVEGEGQLYDRITAEVVLENLGETLTAYVYIFKKKEFLGPVIKDGIWKKKDG